MRISRVEYNERGHMLEPEASHIKMATVIPGSRLTVDPGYYHKTKIEGRTRRELDAKVAEFSAYLDSIGHQVTVIQTRRYSYTLYIIPTIGIEIVYAVGPLTIQPSRRNPAGGIATR